MEKTKITDDIDFYLWDGREYTKSEEKFVIDVYIASKCFNSVAHDTQYNQYYVLELQIIDNKIKAYLREK